MRTQVSRLVSFDGTERVRCRVGRPEHYRDVKTLIEENTRFVARGAGLSYVAASMGGGAVSIDASRLNRILALDAHSGEVTVEAGVRVGELAAFLARCGRFLPVVPGHPSISVGGSVAFDVHGKNQFRHGNFGDWVEALDLVHPGFGKRRATRREHAELFELTIGGLGLTGMITRVVLRTLPLPAPSVHRRVLRASDLVHAAELLEEHASDAAQLYSWHNLLESGSGFGRGFVHVEHFATEPSRGVRSLPFRITRRAGIRLWNQRTARVVFAVHELRERRRESTLMPLTEALFPLSGMGHYYAAFGRAGFREYQLIVPRDRWQRFVSALARLIESERVLVMLASLKLFRGQHSWLRFRQSGICLALNVPADARASSFMRQLDRLAMELGGRPNLSKDSRLDAATCKSLFAEYSRFQEALGRIDPERHCSSNLRERLDV